MESTGPTPPDPGEEPTYPIPPPRRLTRSRTDRVLGGVCGGLGRALGVDPLIVRILTVVLLLAGGLSLVVYVAMLILVPEEAEGVEPPASAQTTNPTVIVLGAVGLLVLAPLLLGLGLVLAAILVPLATIALAGLVTWWLVSGEPFAGDAGDVVRRSALGLLVMVGALLLFGAGFMAAGVGGQTAAAASVVGAGAVLVIGAFVGRVRWVILPALALALGVGMISASGVSLEGGFGDRDYRPASAAAIEDNYELGAGQMVLDLRNAKLPRGDTPLSMRVGMGEAVLVVPKDVCVASKADVGAGAIDVFGDTNAGVNLDWRNRPQAPRRGRRVVVDADVGFGVLLVRHDRRDVNGRHGGRGSRAGTGRGGPFGNYSGPGNVGCSDA